MAMPSMPRVVINGETSSRVMMSPLTRPMAEAARMPRTLAASMASHEPDPTPARNTAVIELATPRMAPTERSIPAVMITDVSATARMSVVEA